MLYFALVSDGEVFDPAVHSRGDLTVFRLSISQAEGEFARAELTVWNTRAPLPGERIFVSEDGVLLFNGEITSVPRGAVGAKISIEAIARPSDADARLDALAESLKTPPHWDPLFADPENRNDIGEILTGHGKVLAWDRISGEVSAVGPLSGASNLTLTPLRDTLSIDIDGKVPAAVRFELRAEWTQLGRQSFDLSRDLRDLATMTPDGLIDGWPRPGQRIGDGFEVSDARGAERLGEPERETIEIQRDVATDELDPVFLDAGTYPDRAEIVPLEAKLKMEYRYEVSRVETASVSLAAGVQDVLRSGEEEVEEIQLQDLAGETDAAPWRAGVEYAAGDLIVDGAEVFEAREGHVSGRRRDPDKWSLIGESSYLSSRRVASFFRTPRGEQAVAHAVERAKARLRYASRAVLLSFDTAMPDPASVSADLAATVQHPGIVGGQATGRVVSYELRWGGGTRDASWEVACAAGTETGIASPTVEPEDGGPVFVGGRADVEIRNAADEQRARFESGGEISPTEVRIRTTPAPSRDFEATVGFDGPDILFIPRQVDYA